MKNSHAILLSVLLGVICSVISVSVFDEIPTFINQTMLYFVLYLFVKSN